MTRNNPVPNVGPCPYGAPMGRHTGPHYLETNAGKITLQRIRINCGGYDSGGAYWGIGQPLFYVADVDGNGWFFRADNRDNAKAIILRDWPEAKFFR